ncbi:Gal4 superdfamily domain-containing protein [Histoplasma capsulatum G186AR]|uniref:Gal4 superdfamily domain-containing protein n=1 Tax=Ajellomyces capsulatus TaxID=5037 RepID=A0A8H7Y9J8_AJECA|nr:Gal4 superdfamily domain-containing protein [Histoplasma capsulatum]QSS70288.1 Gal4 superdfamily domain-containing protein [Histoplasma capsulatum G186AR]
MSPLPIHRNRVGKKRTSCDRCHTLKSKCARAPGSERCSRCERIGIRCVFSASMKLGRPKSLGIFQSPTHQYHKDIEPHATCASSSGISATPVSAPTDMRQQWPVQNMTSDSPSPPLHIVPQFYQGDSAISQSPTPFNYHELSASLSCGVDDPLLLTENDSDWLLNSSKLDTLTGGIPQVANLADFRSSSWTTSPVPISAPNFSECLSNPNSPSDWNCKGDTNTPMYKLSKLHLELDDLLSIPTNCKGTVHPNDIMSSPSSPFPKTAASTPTTPTAAVDAIFLLSENLIEIMQELYQEASTAAYPSLHIYPYMPHASPLRRRCSSNSQQSHLGGQQQEPATALITLTCYLRLLGIYETLVIPLYHYFQQHQKELDTHPNAPFPLPLPLPTFKLGRYEPTSTSDVSLGLLLHLLLRTLECLHTTLGLYLPTTSLSPHSLWAYDGRPPASATNSPTSASDYVEARSISPMADNYQHDEFRVSPDSCSHVTLLTESALSEAGRRERYLTGLLYSAMETFPVMR